MKKIILVLLSAALLTACKKNASSPKQILPSRILVNGHPETEYTYNSEGQILSEKSYAEHDPFALVYRSEYIYDASGALKEMMGYSMPSNKLSSHIVFQLDGQGRIARSAYYSVDGNLPGTFSTYIDYEYSKNGRVLKQFWKDEDEKVQSWRDLMYYPNGNMRAYEQWTQYGGPPAKKAWAASYGPSDTTLPASFYYIKAYPLNFYYNYLTSSYTNQYSYDGDGLVNAEWREDMSGRQFNARGLVSQVTITRKKVMPAGSESVRVLQFEYLEL